MEQLFERLVEFTGDGVVRFGLCDGTVLFANNGFLKIFGVNDSGDALGVMLQDFLGDASFAKLFAVLREKQSVRDLACCFPNRKGEVKRVLCNAFVLDDKKTGVQVVEALFRDVTERSRADEAVAYERNLLRTLIDNLPDFVFLKDTKSRFIVANDAVAHLMGVARAEELIGKTDLDFYPSDLAERYSADERSVISSGQAIIAHEEPCVDPDGNSRWLSTTKAPIRGKNGEVIGLVGVGRDITQHRRVEEALLEALQRFEAVVENTPMVAIQGFDQYGYIRHWNASCVALYGYTREETLGRRIQDVLLHGEEIARFEKILEKIWGDGASTIPEEWVIRTRDGAERWVYSSIFPVFEHGRVVEAFCMDVDITTQKMALNALKDSETKYRNVFEILPMSLFLEDESGRILESNESACGMFGLNREELKGRSIFELLPDCSQTPFGVAFESVGKRANGESFLVEVVSLRVELLGSNMILRHVEDISKEKHAEQEKKRLDSHMQMAQKLESLAILAGGVAHDFNNLLTGILGHASLALMELPISASARDNIKQVETAARRAAELAQQMLVYTGKGQFTVNSVKISEVVEEMAHLLEISISKRCAIRYNFDSDLPVIDADVSQVRQIIMNMIINASDAMADKGGVISVSTGVIDCDSEYLSDVYVNDELPEGRYVYLEVSDNGCGMTPEVREKIFDPFFTTKTSGRGLGLAALLGIVRAHRGAVRVYSEVGRGTTFTVLFPASSSCVWNVVDEKTVMPPCKGDGTILVVDDEEVVRVLARETLQDAGFDVIVAEDGREAVEIYRARANVIAAVVLDLSMPRMDGVETFTEMRRIRNDAPVILSSGYSEQEAMERFAGKGLSGFLHKPYCADSLVRLVHRVACEGRTGNSLK